ncbi:MAG TPA: hypothetical protein VKU19_40030 [Bryobacteraceae bacterium]|nr:hypothetical protein [Bryobacteraceae bacterium]
MTRTLALLAVVWSAAAQVPTIGEINFYGLHKTTPEHILNALHIKTGDPLPPSKGEMEATLERLPNVILGAVEAACCEGSRAAVFIGLEERGAPHAAFHSEPTGDATLPEHLHDSYFQFVGAVARAASHGETAEDLTAGHPMMNDPEARKYTSEFISFATDHLEQLRDVLHMSADADQRTVAAAVIGYAPNKKAVINDLEQAIQDPEESVRGNAIRSLNAIAVLANGHPEMGIKVPGTWLIQLLNSIVLSDRAESTKALLTVTDKGDASTLAQIHDQALPALIEMARWKTPRYALPPFLLLGRVAGLTDAEVQQSWAKDDRETVLSQAQGGKKK